MDYYFKNHKEHLSLDDLNTAYGHMGRTFRREKDAKKHEKSLEDGGYITRLVNYQTNDVVTTANAGVAIEGATPFTIGWLVTAIVKSQPRIKYQGY